LLLLLDHFEFGPAGQVVLTAADLLQRQGFEVESAALGGWGQVGDELEEQGIRAVAIGTASLWDPRAVGRFLSLLRRDRIQIVHSFSVRAGLLARMLARLAGVPAVLSSLHGGDLSGGWWRLLLERFSVPLTDLVVVPSETMRRRAMENLGLGPGQVCVLRTGVAAAPREPRPQTREAESGERESLRRELGAGPHDRLVGVVGELREPRRGLPVFLSAARLLVQQIPQARFVIVGDGPGRRALEARAMAEGVGHRTMFTGIRSDVEAIMHAIDLLVHPNLRPASGFPVLEAMAAGTPVVAASAGDLPELIDDGVTGILVPPGDAPALAQACGALLRDPDRSRRMSEAARRRVAESHSLEGMVAALAGIYRALMEPAAAVAEGRAGRRSA